MLIASGLLALAALSQAAPDPRAAAAATAETPVVASARSWLALVDQNRWQESWGATGAQFQRTNTVQVWTSVSEQMRAQFGTLRSRTLLSQEEVPVPPNGAIVVKFKANYANKPDAIETVSLARENGVWRVVGCYIE